MKKLLSIFLSATLLVSISVTAFANDALPEPPTIADQTIITEPIGERMPAAGYIPSTGDTPEEIAADRKKLEQASPREKMEGRAAYWITLPKTYTYFQQLTATQCAAATAQAVLHYLNGRAPAQSTIANAIGTNGASMKRLLSYINENQEQQDGVAKIPLEIKGQPSIGLLHNSILYHSMAQGKATFYRYDIDTQETIEIGTVDNFVLKGGSSVMVDDILYFYITTTTTENVEGRENLLYGIDLKNNELLYLASDQSSNVLIPVDSLDDTVLSLKGNRSIDNDTFETTLTSYDFNTKSENELFSRILHYGDRTGALMVHFDSVDDKIYVLTEVIVNGQPENKIEIYNKNFTLLDTIDLEKTDAIAEKMGQVILDFKVMGEYIFIRNVSGEAVIAKMSNGGLDVILEGTELDIASSFMGREQLNYQVFFERESNYYYILDEEKGLLKQTLTLEPDSVIRTAYMDENGVLFLLIKDTDVRAEQTQSIYYFENSYLLSDV